MELFDAVYFILVGLMGPDDIVIFLFFFLRETWYNVLCFLFEWREISHV